MHNNLELIHEDLRPQLISTCRLFVVNNEKYSISDKALSS